MVGLLATHEKAALCQVLLVVSSKEAATDQWGPKHRSSILLTKEGLGHATGRLGQMAGPLFHTSGAHFWELIAPRRISASAYHLGSCQLAV
jgi:hypothetical protein